MKRVFAFLLGVLVLVLFSSAWAQCPEDPLDLGSCDTFHVTAWAETDTCLDGDCENYKINTPGEDFPCFAYVTLLVTHDSNTFYWETESKWLQDSISAFTLPLVWTPTNQAAYCSLSGYWNENATNPYDPRFPRSIWRHFEVSELDSNRMSSLAAQFQGLEWGTVITNWTNDSSWFKFGDDSVYTPPRMWTILIPSTPSNRRWWESERTLLITATFRVEDSTTICIDSTLWPPTGHLEFTRMDAEVYIARHNLPVCFWVHDGIVEVVGGTDVRWIEGSAEEENRPTSFSVSQNYPNPFNPATEFKFDLPRACHVEIEVFNILGQRVKTLVDERRAVGSHVVDWDGKDARGVDVSSGIYFYRMIADDFSDIKKMVLLK